MKPLLATLTLALLASFASATCTPLNINPYSTPEDLSGGPTTVFKVNGNVLPQNNESDPFILITTDMQIDIATSGYVLDHPGFGGCTLNLNDFINFELKVTNVTTGQLVYDHTTQSTEYMCAFTYSCYFDVDWGGPTLGTAYGDTYQILIIVTPYMYGVGYGTAYTQSTYLHRENRRPLVVEPVQ